MPVRGFAVIAGACFFPKSMIFLFLPVFFQAQEKTFGRGKGSPGMAGLVVGLR
jgi:hypothetical protein